MRTNKTLLLLIALTISLSSFSQFSMGLETMSMRHPSTQIGKFGVGGSFRYEAQIQNKWNWTSAVGYLSFHDRFQDESVSSQIISLSGGIKYYFSQTRKGLYAASDLGFNYISSVASLGPPFSYPITFKHVSVPYYTCAGVGYKFTRLDLTAKYNVMGGYYAPFSSPVFYLSLRAAYVFGRQ